MKEMDPLYINPDGKEIRREKDKARSLRKTEWWRKKVAKGVCFYCNKKVGRAKLTMDHLVPLSRGGKSKKGNLVPACKECNNRKKSLLPLEWQEYLKHLAEQGEAKAYPEEPHEF